MKYLKLYFIKNWKQFKPKMNKRKNESRLYITKHQNGKEKSIVYHKPTRENKRACEFSLKQKQHACLFKAGVQNITEV